MFDVIDLATALGETLAISKQAGEEAEKIYSRLAYELTGCPAGWSGPIPDEAEIKALLEKYI